MTDSKTPESELETYCEWICIQDYLALGWLQGHVFYFHEDQPVNKYYFQMVVNEQDEPITKMVRKC